MFQLSVSVRNSRLDTIESTIGTAAQLRIFTGSEPANCAAGDSGTKLVEISLPSDWMANAASGSKSMLGTWINTAIANGTAGYFRIYDSAFAACHIQGNCTVTGGGGDMTIDNVSIVSGANVKVTAFTLTDSNA